MDCRKSQILSMRRTASDLVPGSPQIRESDAHLLSCRPCARDYEGKGSAGGTAEVRKAKSAEGIKPQEKEPDKVGEIERDWSCAKAELDKTEDQSEKGKSGKIRRALQKIVTAESQDFCNIYRDYRPTVTNYLLSRNGHLDRASIEDITQEVFVRFWNNRHRYENRSSVLTYLVGIANNVMADEMKRLARETKFCHEKLLGFLPKDPGGSTDPQLQARRLEFVRAVAQAISQLTKEQRQATRAVYYEGLSLEQAAQRCNCSIRAVERCLCRARRKLQRLLSHLTP